MEIVMALRITDVSYGPNGLTSAQMDALDHEKGYLGFEDNGGEPDGNTRLIWPVHVNDADVKKALAILGSFGERAQVVRGFEVPYSADCLEDMAGRGFSRDPWSGVGSAGRAFFTNEADARLSEAYVDANHKP